MNIFNIERTFKLKVDRNWDTLYVAVDLHGTIAKPYHDCLEYYNGAVEVLKWFNKRADFKLILWTSSYPREILQFLAEMKSKDVNFDFINENPLEKNRGFACFEQKFYFNILLDDKAGFDPETDWLLIKQELIRIGEWDKV